MDENLKSLFRNPIQIGLIVRDLDEVLKNMDEILGVGPFSIVDFPPEGSNVKMMYKGENSSFKAKFCFFNLGNIELEIIQPLEGDTVWGDFLKGTNGMGLHHLKFLVPEHGPVKEHMESKGISVSQMGSSVGKNAGKEWVFYDTEDKLGFALEIMNKIPDKKE